MKAVDKVINEALSWVGYLEKKSNAQLESFTENAGYNNYTIFWKYWYEFYGTNYQGQYWCAAFISVSFARALGVDIAKKILTPYINCANCKKTFIKQGIWKTSNPKRGDVIIFNDSSGTPCHTGLVYNVDSSRVHTVEGNTSSGSSVIDNGGAVAIKSYPLNYDRIAGYGDINYSLIDEDDFKWTEDIYNATGIVTADRLNVRTSPTTEYDSNIIGSFIKGDIIEIIAKVVEVNWYKVKSYAGESYVSAEYVETEGVCYLDAMYRLLEKGFISDVQTWSDYNAGLSYGLMLAIVDKLTGGTWTSDEVLVDHWSNANLVSLCGKGIIQDKNSWLDINLDDNIHKDRFIALIAKAINVNTVSYEGLAYDNYARKYLNAMCDEGIINTPSAWTDWSSDVPRGNAMCLLVKAFNI